MNKIPVTIFWDVAALCGTTYFGSYLGLRVASKACRRSLDAPFQQYQGQLAWEENEQFELWRFIYLRELEFPAPHPYDCLEWDYDRARLLGREDEIAWREVEDEETEHWYAGRDPDDWSD